jgi:hypothetical protein
MAEIRMAVFPAGRGEKISISFSAGGGSGDVSLTPIEALILAQSLAQNARISMCGPKENPDNNLVPQLVMAGSVLDHVGTALAEVVHQLG